MDFKKRLYISYFLALHLLSAILILRSETMDIALSFIGYKNDSKEFDDFYYQMLTVHERIDKNIPKNSIILIGDSHAQSLATTNLQGSVVNYGIAGDTTLGVLQRIPKYKSIDKSKAVILIVGHNDLIKRSKSEITTNFKKIGALLPLNTQVILLSIFYTDNNTTNNKKLNDKAKLVNISLKELCDQKSNTHCFDLNPEISESESLLDIFHIGDGIHLNQLGNEILINKLNQLINITNRK